MGQTVGVFPDFRLLRAFKGRVKCVTIGCYKLPIKGRQHCPVHAPPGRVSKAKDAAGLEPGKAYVYAIKCGDYIKIGQTRTPSKRLAALQGSNPHDLEILGCVLTFGYIEKCIHAYLEADCHRLEWFAPTPRVMSIVDMIVGKKAQELFDVLAAQRAAHVAKRI